MRLSSCDDRKSRVLIESRMGKSGVQVVETVEHVSRPEQYVIQICPLQ